MAEPQEAASIAVYLVEQLRIRTSYTHSITLLHSRKLPCSITLHGPSPRAPRHDGTKRLSGRSRGGVPRAATTHGACKTRGFPANDYPRNRALAALGPLATKDRAEDISRRGSTRSSTTTDDGQTWTLIRQCLPVPSSRQSGATAALRLFVGNPRPFCGRSRLTRPQCVCR